MKNIYRIMAATLAVIIVAAAVFSNAFGVKSLRKTYSLGAGKTIHVNSAVPLPESEQKPKTKPRRNKSPRERGEDVANPDNRLQKRHNKSPRKSGEGGESFVKGERSFGNIAGRPSGDLSNRANCPNCPDCPDCPTCPTCPDCKKDGNEIKTAPNAKSIKSIKKAPNAQNVQNAQNGQKEQKKAAQNEQ